MKAYALAFLDFFEKSFKMDAFCCYTCSMMLVYISNSFANFETTTLVIYHMVQKQNLIVHMYIIIPRMYTN